MEINKQLFEDVLSGKLKGTFMLRNGDKIKSHKLSINTIDPNTVSYPIVLVGGLYTYQGRFDLLTRNHPLDIIDFIPDTNMKQNKLTIEIPYNKVVDWDESKKQNKIVLKNKQLTYEDICKKLFENKKIFYTGASGVIDSVQYSEIKDCICDENNATTEHQLECILAKNMLANVAVYLNDGWKPDFSDALRVFVIYNESETNTIGIDNENSLYAKDMGHIIFKSKEFAEQAIEILGEETVKLALEPLGI